MPVGPVHHRGDGQFAALADLGCWACGHWCAPRFRGGLRRRWDALSPIWGVGSTVLSRK